MKPFLITFTSVALLTPAAFGADIKPYFGVGLVVDKAGTSAKRVGFNPDNIQLKLTPDIMKNPDINALMGDAMNSAIIRDGGGDMKFDMAIAGEFVAGIKWGPIRAELEAAFRSASEDEYDIFNGSFTPIKNILTVNAAIATSTKVTHNSYMANFYYDFNIPASKWEPYVGGGIGIGTYKQKATVDVSGDAKFMAKNIPFGQSMTVLENNETVFEWQIGLGAAYHINDTWALDMGYRFNSSTIGGEFVYAHEIKLGGRYTF